MSAREFDDWYAAYQRDPWGPERGDRRMARIVWSVLVGKSKRPPREADFLLDFRPREPLTPDQLARKINRAMVGHGGGPSLAAAAAAGAGGGNARAGEC